MDGVVYGPACICSFFAWSKLLEGGTLEEVKRKVQRDFLATYIFETGFWPVVQVRGGGGLGGAGGAPAAPDRRRPRPPPPPPATSQALNFRWIPVKHQLMVVNLFSIVDGCFMSWTSHHPSWSDGLSDFLSEHAGFALPQFGADAEGEGRGEPSPEL